MSETKEPHVAGAPPDDTPAAVHTDPAPETDAPVQTEPEVKRKRGRPRKNPAPENESGNEAKDENALQPNFVISGDQRVLSIDSRRTVETDADKAKNNLLDLMESLRSKRILTGMIQCVEGNPDSEPRAVVYRGEFKILIPASLCIERPTDFRGMKPNDVLKYQITKRLGAEIEYIVKGIDPESGVVVASRMDAMEIRRRQFYYGTWVTHLMIADGVLKHFPSLDRHGFCVGNIAPDCNVENEDWTVFTPSREVTHWMQGERKKASDCDSFCEKYITSRRDEIKSAEEYAFILGYYAHLITDAAFQAMIRNEDRVKAAWSRIKADEELSSASEGMEETWDTIKKLVPKRERMRRIYVIEGEYLCDHPDSGYLTEILSLKEFPDYIDYLPSGAIVRKIGVMGYMPEPDDSVTKFITMS